MKPKKLAMITFLKKHRPMGYTLQELGEHFGCSKEYIRQLCKEYGIEKDRPIEPAKPEKFSKEVYKTRLFKKKIDNLETGCWEWTGYKDLQGYGRISYKGQAD